VISNYRRKISKHFCVNDVLLNCRARDWPIMSWSRQGMLAGKGRSWNDTSKCILLKHIQPASKVAARSRRRRGARAPRSWVLLGGALLQMRLHSNKYNRDRGPPNEEPKQGEPALSQRTIELAGFSEGGLVEATHQIPNSTAACHVTNWESTSLNFLAKCYRLISLKFELDFIPYN